MIVIMISVCGAISAASVDHVTLVLQVVAVPREFPPPLPQFQVSVGPELLVKTFSELRLASRLAVSSLIGGMREGGQVFAERSSGLHVGGKKKKRRMEKIVIHKTTIAL